ncbi:MAG: M48 family metallopeptidase [Phycisphaeraceae bacterium]|nr:M48 family metallopeptidase [Phycisphaeraceae bacterium]
MSTTENRPSLPSDVHAYPADVTFEDLLAHNRRESVWLLGGMGLLVVAVAMAATALVMVYGMGSVNRQGLLIAGAAGLAVSLLTGTWSYFGGAQTVLAISGARELARAEDPQLFNVVEELAIAGGLPAPKVYLMDSPALNAFATGRDPQHAAVAITRGLREKLTRDELQGVMAHEMAHVRHLDIRLMMLVATLAGLIVLTCDITWRVLRGMGRGGRGSSRRGGKGGGAAILIVLVLAILLAIVAPLVARLIQFAISRQREYLADAGAVELTRYPKGLADALRKLAADSTPLEHANRATAHMYIVNPILQAKERMEVDSVFATHPPIGKRIARLEALMR